MAKKWREIGIVCGLVGLGLSVLVVVPLVREGIKVGGPINHAKEVCEVAIKAHLKSPASAIFEYSIETKFIQEGTVDSQNSFGALLRSSFKCMGADVGDPIVWIDDEPIL